MAKKKTGKKRVAKRSAQKRSAKKRRTKKRPTRKRATKKRPTRKRAATRAAAASPADDRAAGFRLNNEEAERALMSGAHREHLEAYFGEQGYAEMRALAAQAQRRSVRGGPRVLILPGIMGSKLGKPRAIFDDTIWIDPIDVIRGRLSRLTLKAGADTIKPLGVILLSYLALKLRLNLAGFDADFHPFDWRQDIDRLGAELVRRIKTETTGGRRSHLYLVAHSMGGLVSRAALADLGAKDKRVRRLIMLGTPNYGSFVPVQALRGSHSLVRKVAALDLKHTPDELATDIFGTFPGLYQMLPAREKFSGVNIFDPATWPAIGPKPRPAILRAAAAIHDKLAKGDDRMTLIAGVEQETLIDLSVKDGEFEYGSSLDGDGTVPLDFARLENVKTYYVEESHGSLPNNRTVARAVGDILHTGETDEMPSTWTSRRRAAAWRTMESGFRDKPFGDREGASISQREIRHLIEEVAAPPERAPEATLASGSAIVAHGTSAEPIVVGRRRQHRLDLRLAHGSITQVDTRAVVLGLFRDVAPTGAAGAIDECIGGAITEFTSRRMFSGNVGEIFIMPAGRQEIGAELVLFAGLGAFDEFKDEVLCLTAEHIARTLIKTKVDEFATVLIGTGSGSELRDALTNLVEGFFRGLKDSDQRHRLRSITLCEMDSDRYAMMRTEILRLATTSLFDDVEVTVEEIDMPPVAPPPPARGPTIPRTEDPVYLYVRQVGRRNGPLEFQASTLTAGDKAAVVSESVEEEGKGDLDKHLAKIGRDDFTHANLDAFGTKLARMVLPKKITSLLESTFRDRSLVVIHDAESSRIPWETICVNGWFPSAGAGLTRKYAAADLSIAKYLEERRYGTILDLLLVVDPTEDLDGAKKEGDRVKAMFGDDAQVRIHELRGPDATKPALQSAFQSGRYDVLHYAGHAYFDERNRSRSGIVCYGEDVLSGAELAGIGRLPALVFFNACEAGRIRSWTSTAARATKERDPIDRNVGLAEAFLRGGVANYVGTYWPVQDASAKVFSKSFYRLLLGGATIGAALLKSRNLVRGKKLVDWADYIHYGSPRFVLKYPPEA